LWDCYFNNLSSQLLKKLNLLDTTFLVNRWLQNFAYRVRLDILTFALSGILVLAIALLTVSYQSIKAAIANPVDSLRYE